MLVYRGFCVARGRLKCARYTSDTVQVPELVMVEYPQRDGEDSVPVKSLHPYARQLFHFFGRDLPFIFHRHMQGTSGAPVRHGWCGELIQQCKVTGGL